MASDPSGAAATRPAPPAPRRPRGRPRHAGGEAYSNYRESRESFLKHAGRLDAAKKKLFGNAKKPLDTSGGSLIKGGKAKDTNKQRGEEKRNFWQGQKTA